MISDRWLFKSHSRNELGAWARRLRFFRFVRAVGGHANDGDQLVAALTWADEGDLVSLLDDVGLTPDPARPTSSHVDGLPERAQPGHAHLGGEPVFAWVYPGRVELHVAGAAGDPYEVTERDIERAERLETLLEPYAARVLDPPREGERVVSPATRPELFTEDASADG